MILITIVLLYDNFISSKEIIQYPKILEPHDGMEIVLYQKNEDVTLEGNIFIAPENEKVRVLFIIFFFNDLL